MQQNNGNYQDIKSAPDNPYTQYYHEYLVDPGVPSNEVTKPKRVASIILCAISNILMLSFCVMWYVLIYMNLTGYKVSIIIDTDNCLVFSITLFLFLSPGLLVPTIIAKITNRKSKWAIVNFIGIFLILAAVIVASLTVVPSWAEKLAIEKSKRAEEFSEDWNREVEKLFAKYDFDITDSSGDYEYREGNDYEIWVYVSADASEYQVSQVNEFMCDLQEFGTKYSEFPVTVTVHPVYFDPDKDPGFVIQKKYDFTCVAYESNPDKIERVLYILDFAQWEEGHVPEEVEKGDALIVVR